MHSRRSQAGSLTGIPDSGKADSHESNREGSAGSNRGPGKSGTRASGQAGSRPGGQKETATANQDSIQKKSYNATFTTNPPVIDGSIEDDAWLAGNGRAILPSLNLTMAHPYTKNRIQDPV
ncbi:MAG: hypothetical protein R2756_06190 [Bacteroidales bacterium]